MKKRISNRRFAVVLIFSALSSSAWPVAGAITWDGSTSGNWNTTSNWDLNRVPDSTEEVIFPTAGANKTMNNNRPAGTAFRQLTFQASGYSLSGNGLTLATSGSAPRIRTTHSTGTVSLGAPLTWQNTGTIEIGAGGTLRLNTGSSVNLGANTLNCDVDGELDIYSEISGTGGLNVLGSGRVTFIESQSFTGTTSITGRLELRDLGVVSTTIAGPVTSFNGSELSGRGELKEDFNSFGGTISPGQSSSQVASALIFKKDLLQNSAGTKSLVFDVWDDTPSLGYDSLRVEGACTLQNTALDLRVQAPLEPGQVYKLIDKVSAGAITVSGTITDAVGGTISFTPTQQFVTGHAVLTYSRTGGNGNDLTATSVMPTASLSQHAWAGSAGSTNWGDAVNWNTLPTGGGTLTFGSTAPSNRRAVTGNFGGTYFRLAFTAPGYVLTPASVGNFPLYVAEATTSHTGVGATTINEPLNFRHPSNGSTLRNESTGPLLVNGAVDAVGDLEVEEVGSGASSYTRIAGAISVTGNLDKSGAGRLEVEDVTAPVVRVLAGEIQVDGTMSGGELRTAAGARVSGSGSLSSLTMVAGGTCAPGGAQGDILSASSFNVATTATLEPVIRATSGTGLLVTGAVTFTTMRLQPVVEGFTLGRTYVIFNKTTSGAFSGRFVSPQGSTLQEGDLFRVGLYRFQISYQGGDGNDVTLTAYSVTTPSMVVTSFQANPVPGFTNRRRIQLTATAGSLAAGVTLRLEGSTDLSFWTSLTTTIANGSGTGSFDYIDTLASGPKRFYRVALVP